MDKMHTRGRPSWESGFSLAELLLACGILAAALTGILMLFINCSFSNEANRNLAIATGHASYILEEIRGESFSGLEARITGNDWDFNGQELQTLYSLTPLNSETIDASVTQSGNPLGVSIRVDWLDHRQRPRNTVLNTLLTDYQ